MCGRYSQTAEFSELKLELALDRLELFREFRPTYNIAPSYGSGSEQLFVVRDSEDGAHVGRLGRWWLIPSYWNRPLRALPTAFNARAEELSKKPFWQGAFKRQRCLVPATGWREFKPERGRKQPYHFQLDRGVFAFAGLWSSWTSAEGELVESFAIITTEPCAAASAIHDRMPLVMPGDLSRAWLDPANDGSALLAEACAGSRRLKLEIFPTNPLGNNVRFEGPEVVERIELAVRATPDEPAPVQLSLFPK